MSTPSWVDSTPVVATEPPDFISHIGARTADDCMFHPVGSVSAWALLLKANTKKQRSVL
jgi:hypothetical protein